MTGRPSKRTPEIDDEIIARISDGETLRAICRDDHMPHHTTAYDWISADPALSLRFAHARVKGFDAIAEECREIADDGSRDYKPKTMHDGSVEYVPDQDHIQRSRLRVDTRLKLLAKWDPKRYGDALNLKHSDPEGKPLAAIINVTIGGKKTEDV